MAQRRAFSLTELIVSIAVISVLISLLLPAVNSARESARAVTCSNHLKQIGIAFHNHHDTFGVFPGNGAQDQDQTITHFTTGSPVSIFTHRQQTNTPYYWGVGDPGLGPDKQVGSWAFSLLPFMEGTTVYEKRDWTTAVPTYVCPSRRSATATPVVSRDEFNVYEGGGWNWSNTDYAGNSEAIPNHPDQKETHLLSMKDFTDGTSATILAGEKAYDPSLCEGTWYWDEPLFTGGSQGTQRNGLQVMQDAEGIVLQENGLAHWGSPHPGGAHFLLTDGSVQRVTYDVSWLVMKDMLSPSSGIYP